MKIDEIIIVNADLSIKQGSKAMAAMATADCSCEDELEIPCENGI